MAGNKASRKSKGGSRLAKAGKAPATSRAPKTPKSPKSPKAPKTPETLKSPKAPKPPKTPKLAKAPATKADDSGARKFSALLHTESHDRVETLIALEVIARAGFLPSRSGEASGKKVELTDARKTVLKTIAEQLKREIKYVRKFL